MMRYKLIASLVIICLIAIFIIQNATVVEIKLLFWTISMSRVLLMFILLAIGVLAGWLISGHFSHRKKSKSQKP